MEVVRNAPPAEATGPSRASRPGRRARRAALGALAAVAGALPALAFPEPGLWWLGLVGFVPLLLLIRSAATPRGAMVRAWLGGSAFMLAAHHWLVPTVGVFTLPLAVVFGAPVALWGRAAWHLMRSATSPARTLRAAVVLAGGWVLVEALRSWDRLGGPWDLLGASQWRTRWLLASAALGGVWLVSFGLVVVNVAVAGAVAPGVPARARIAAAGLAVLTLAAAGLWSATRPDLGTGATVRVVGVQPGVIHEVGPRFAASEAATARVGSLHPDLVVWGESSVGLDPREETGYLRRIEAAARAAGADILVNVDARRAAGEGIYKTALLVGPDGPRGSYDKMRLVPFGEYVPLRRVFAWVESVSRAPGEDRRRGDGLVLLETRGLMLGPLICFESAFPDMARRLAGMGADVIVVQSSTSTFQQSWAPEQHASLAAVRAVETGRPVVHATLTGVSAGFDATGRRLVWLGTSERGTYVADLPLARGRTPYVRYGDWVVVASVVVVAAALGPAGWRRARSARLGSRLL
ncbi:MAG TPA: apolipoprotein N-acyltransferase [Acidimicrobiales bacterium]|nr:apolipoprotein N-acyltransferase [Acidimicrobiales bacterium]